MNVESVREYCLSLPHATEIMQWGDHVLFKIGGKMFCILSLDGPSLSLKCTHESYADMVERVGILPCSHNMWKHQWITLESLGAVFDNELRELLGTSYRLVYEKLTKKTRAQLDGSRADKKAGPKRRPARMAARR